jgi:hypothetical protein
LRIYNLPPELYNEGEQMEYTEMVRIGADFALLSDTAHLSPSSGWRKYSLWVSSSHTGLSFIMNFHV